MALLRKLIVAGGPGDPRAICRRGTEIPEAGSVLVAANGPTAGWSVVLSEPGVCWHGPSRRSVAE